jgi:DNA-binding NtrC family response regulator
MSQDVLRGYRILVVEDNAPLATFLVEALHDAGAEVVGPAATLSAAQRLAGADDRLSAALLDIRLREGEEVWPVAWLLAGKNVPFVFYTGHHDASTLPAEWRGRPIVTKPSRVNIILDALVQVVKAR